MGVSWFLSDREGVDGMRYSYANAWRDFDWLGFVDDIHEISDFVVVEYRERKTGKRRFGGVSGGKSVGESWSTLDAAIIGMLARKYNEVNLAVRAAYLVTKMLSIPDGTNQAEAA